MYNLCLVWMFVPDPNSLKFIESAFELLFKKKLV